MAAARSGSSPASTEEAAQSSVGRLGVRRSGAMHGRRKLGLPRGYARRCDFGLGRASDGPGGPCALELGGGGYGVDGASVGVDFKVRLGFPQ